MVGNRGTAMAVGGDWLRASSAFQGFSKLWSHPCPHWVLLSFPLHPSPVPYPCPSPPAWEGNMCPPGWSWAPSSPIFEDGTLFHTPRV